MRFSWVAALGGCFGGALLHVLPGLPMTPAHFAYAGIGMVGGTTGAVLTGTIMIRCISFSSGRRLTRRPINTR